MKPSKFLEIKQKEYGIKYPEKTVTERLEELNSSYLDQVAIQYYNNNITYEKLFEKIDLYNKAFVSYGIKKGDYVSACLPTIPESIYMFYALNKIGAKFHTILPMLTTEQLVQTLDSNKSKLFLTLDSLYTRVDDALKITDVPFKVKVSANTSLPPLAKQLKIVSDILKGETYKDIPKDYLTLGNFLKNGYKSEVVSNPWEAGKVAAVTNSSGSTGDNKGTELTDYGFNSMVCNYLQALPDVKRGQSFHSCIPLLYSTGLSNSVNLPLQLGLVTKLDPIFDRDLYPKSFMKLKPNLSIVPVPYAKSLLDYLRKVYRDSKHNNKNMLSFVDVFSVGGSHLPIPWEEELIYYLEYFGSSSSVGKGYGLSEHNSALTVSTETMIGSAGKVLPSVILGIFDPVTGDELDFGQEGLIRAISPGDMTSYFDNEELTNNYFMTDTAGRRWGKTGDIGRLELINGEVWLFYSGREKDVLNINNTDILLSRVQNKILECNLIDDCEIVAVTKNDNQMLIGHIVLKNEHISAEEVLKELASIFTDHKELEPYAYKIHDKLPVLISGKTDKNKLQSETTEAIKYEFGKITSINFDNKVLKKV